MIEAELARPDQARTTSDKILDAAEDLFAEKGYSATSLGDVADKVGIRSPSLYNHFKNKEALYKAVLNRLLDSFTSPLEELTSSPITQQRVLDWLETIVRLHHSRSRSPCPTRVPESRHGIWRPAVSIQRNTPEDRYHPRSKRVPRPS